VLWEGQILDGRNRLAACDLAGVVPVFKALAHCPDPVAYVLSANLHRRHLTDDDRALCAAQMKKHYQDRAAKNHAEASKTGGRGNKKTVKSGDLTVSEGGYWYQLAALDWKVSPSAIQRADTLLAQRETLPELHDAVKVAKTVSLSGAATMAKAVTSGAVTVEEVKAAVASKTTAAKLTNKIRDTKPAGKGGGGKSKGAPAPAAPAATTPAEEKPAPPARHPVLVEIDAARDTAALDRAFNRIALANLSEAESAEASAAYQRRAAELRAQGPATTAAPGSVSPQATTAQPVQATAPQDQGDLFAGIAKSMVRDDELNALDLADRLREAVARLVRDGRPIPPSLTGDLAGMVRKWCGS
jgi:hypothetical protein